MCGWAPFECFENQDDVWNKAVDDALLARNETYAANRQAGLDRLQDPEEESSQPGQGLGYKIVKTMADEPRQVR